MRIKPKFLPSAQEIVARCYAIRRNWTASERQKRLGWFGETPVETTAIVGIPLHRPMRPSA
ncbi:MAG: hypothetical protein SGJ19_01705 [Planctomycetia bacterium]|nr:hypothetical protein [Planctomycetia bacterium]